MSLPAVFAAQPKPLIVGETVAAIVLVGVADYLTQWELSLFVVYGLPIFVAGWCAGRRAAFAIACAAGVAWFLANLQGAPYATRSGYAWAATNRLAYFLFVAVGTSAMRQQRETARERIEALTLLREQELAVVRAVESERVRIGQDLHDGICQNLAAIDLATLCLRRELETAGLGPVALAGKIQGFLQETMIEARNLARGIVPIQVEHGGLVLALRELVARANLARDGAASFASPGEIQVTDQQVAVHLYRIAQEAMSNAARHAQATHVALSLRVVGDTLILAISDNGSGFASEINRTEGLGLRTMRYRAALIHADLEVISAPGAGTTIQCALPHAGSPGLLPAPATAS